MKIIDYIKMNGLGNDFIIIDSRKKKINLKKNEIEILSNRQKGIGCDQLIIIQPNKNDNADCFMKIYNSDGSESPACGNATRCVASIIMNEFNTKDCKIETNADILECSYKNELISVNMGIIKTNYKDIPLSKNIDTSNIAFNINNQEHSGFCLNIGNPHIVFFMNSINSIDIEREGYKISTDPIFKEGTNVEFAKIIDDKNIRMKVFERGVGITKACGSGACAVACAAYKKGLTNHKVNITLDGGILNIKVMENNSVIMTGPYETEYTGEYTFT